MKCNNCNTENRPEAKFCKHCGTALLQDNPYADFYGKGGIKAEMEKFSTLVDAAARIRKLGTGVRIGTDCIIMGDSGTGKHFVAGKLYDILLKAGTVSMPSPVTVDAADWNKWQEKFDENLKGAAEGVLMITNAQKLLPDGIAKNVNNLDRLFQRMKSQPQGMPIVFLCGLRQGLESFMKCNPDAASLFECRFELKTLDKEDLTQICTGLLKSKFKLEVSDQAREKFLKRFDYLIRNGQDAGCGHIAELEAQNAGVKAVLSAGTTVLPEHIDGKVFEPRTEEEIWKELDAFVGMQNVKDEIRSIIDGIKDARRCGAPMKIEDHYVFTGNPGTGKTTIARCFADILNAIGVLPKGQFVEVAGKDLIADVVGGSERNVQDAIDKAMGGVLFIDEAYGLNDGNFGQAAIDKLLPIVENLRGKFVCIIAGYAREMRDFMKANSGLESRFNKTIDFPDYNASELEDIFRSMATGKGYALSQEASEKLHVEMERMYNRRTENFGNARDVRNRLREAEDRRRARLRGMSDAELAREGKTLTYADIAGQDAQQNINLADIMKELDGLVGLESVKHDIRALAAGVRREQMLCQLEGRTPNIVAEHYLFLGNPGTGKTTVARLMGKMLYALGLISRPDVLEVGRQDLVGRFQGDTAQLTRDAVMRAMGGILFIDEAYSIAGGEHDNYGQECINTLVPLLENHQGKFVCICAGYTREMQDFLDGNSGLRSRLTKKIYFEDYNAEELYEIFLLNCKKEGLCLDEDAAEAAREALNRMYAARTYDFGNAREVRTFVRNIKNRLAERTMLLDNPTSADLKTIKVEDII